MRNKLKYTGLLLSLALPFSSAVADNLIGVYKLALKNDTGIAIAEHQALSSTEGTKQAQAKWLPEVAFSSTGSINWVDNGNNPLIDERSDNTHHELSLTQVVYNHQVNVGLTLAEKQAQLSNLKLQAEQQSLMLKVAERYFDILAAKDQVVFAQKEKEAIGQQLAQAKERFDVGQIAITSVHEAQAQYDQAHAGEIAAQNFLDIAWENLWEITLETPSELTPLSQDVKLSNQAPEDLQYWIDTAEQNNLALQMAKLQKSLAKENIAFNKGGHYPSVFLTAGTSYDTTESTIGKGPNSQVMLSVSIPLYSGGATSSAVSESYHLLNAANQQEEAQRRGIVKGVRSLYLSISANLASVQALAQGVVSAESAEKATQAGFAVGTRNIVDVLAATRSVFFAKKQLSRKKYDYFLDWLRLKQVAGVLSENDLADLSQWLEPA